MALSDSQREILQRINKNLEYGDITAIAEKLGKTRVYVSGVLNPETRPYNDEVVNAAVKLIAEREQGRKKMLDKLPV